MDCRVINMEQDPRREQYAYFRNFANPYVGLTVNVDITGLMARKEQGESLFLLVLYAVSRAANSVPELRRRIRGEQVVEYSWCPTSHTVALDNGAYCYCRLSADISLADFLPYAKAVKMQASRRPRWMTGRMGRACSSSPVYPGSAIRPWSSRCPHRRTVIPASHGEGIFNRRGGPCCR